MALNPKLGVRTDVDFVSERSLQTKLPIAVIDLSKESVKSQVVRDGKTVPQVTLKKSVIDDIVGTAITAGDVPRVISQSVATGTRVARGTKVDIVLTPRKKIPIDIFTDIHIGFGTSPAVHNVDDMVTGFLTPTVSNAVLDFDTADQVPASTRAAIETELTAKGITIDASNPSKSFEAAFKTLKGAAAFK